MVRHLLAAALLVFTASTAAQAVVVERTLVGRITAVADGASFPFPADPTVTTFVRFDTANEVAPGQFTATDLFIALPVGATFTQDSEQLGTEFPLIDFDGTSILGIRSVLLLTVAGIDLELEFLGTFGETDFTVSTTDGEILGQGIVTPIPAALPLLGAALAGLGFYARRRA